MTTKFKPPGLNDVREVVMFCCISELVNADGTPSTADPGVEISISKAAVEPVWYLPGVAERFGM